MTSINCTVMHMSSKAACHRALELALPVDSAATERERDRERERDIYIYIHTYIHTYMAHTSASGQFLSSVAFSQLHSRLQWLLITFPCFLFFSSLPFLP